jgi:uncharacterized membrane protein YedE/YeeE
MVSRQIVVALVAGLVFGAGLAISGMADPTRVRAFLDIAGAWDPTLAFVMAGALMPMAAAWLVKRRMKTPIAAPSFDVPVTTRLDLPLFTGAALFGVGWGVAGLCPGPAVANLAINPTRAAVFVAAMLVGMAAYRLLSRPRIPAN